MLWALGPDGLRCHTRLCCEGAAGSGDETGSWARAWVWPEGAVGRPLVAHPLASRLFPPRPYQPLPLTLLPHPPSQCVAVEPLAPGEQGLQHELVLFVL